MIDIRQGDCLELMAALPADSVDTIICDPPYGLSFMGKDWDKAVPGPEYWKAALRVAKPGAILLAFGGTRLQHRLICAIEDAGWQIRDCMMWMYGSGFPKSLDISKAIDSEAGAERERLGVGIYADGTKQRPAGRAGISGDKRGQAYITAPATDAAKTWDGWGTALKPAYEPICLAMKPLDGTFAQNAIKHGVAGLHIDGGRIEANGRPRIVNKRRKSGMIFSTQSGIAAGKTSQGRWPANLILDEHAAEMLDAQSGDRPSCNTPSSAKPESKFRPGQGRCQPQGKIYPGDSGGASRFFYCAKASSSERGEGNNHPSVKPVKLMEYLCKLTATPTGGVVLDPFMGSGSTGIACVNTGRSFIGMELDEGYFRIAKDRIEAEAMKPQQQALF